MCVDWISITSRNLVAQICNKTLWMTYSHIIWSNRPVKQVCTQVLLCFFTLHTCMSCDNLVTCPFHKHIGLMYYGEKFNCSIFMTNATVETVLPYHIISKAYLNISPFLRDRVAKFCNPVFKVASDWSECFNVCKSIDRVEARVLVVQAIWGDVCWKAPIQNVFELCNLIEVFFF